MEQSAKSKLNSTGIYHNPFQNYTPNMDPGSLLLELRQGNRPIEEYVKEFLNLSYRVNFGDLALKDIFRFGLNDNLRYLMPNSREIESFQDFIDFALLLSGSSFTVGEVEVDATPKHFLGGGSRHQAPWAGQSDHPQTPVCTTFTLSSPVLAMSVLQKPAEAMPVSVPKMAATMPVPVPKIDATMPVSMSRMAIRRTPFSKRAARPAPVPKMAAAMIAPVFKMATAIPAPVIKRAIAISTPVPQRAVAIPAPVIKMAAMPAPVHKMAAAAPEPVHKMAAAAPEPVHKMAAAAPEPVHKMAAAASEPSESPESSEPSESPESSEPSESPESSEPSESPESSEPSESPESSEPSESPESSESSESPELPVLERPPSPGREKKQRYSQGKCSRQLGRFSPWDTVSLRDGSEGSTQGKHKVSIPDTWAVSLCGTLYRCVMALKVQHRGDVTPTPPLKGRKAGETQGGKIYRPQAAVDVRMSACTMAPLQMVRFKTVIVGRTLPSPLLQLTGSEI
nr:chromosome alignment-maintaining phosphoprotein 1-like [Misgurnus anguillicaudatus]